MASEPANHYHSSNRDHKSDSNADSTTVSTSNLNSFQAPVECDDYRNMECFYDEFAHICDTANKSKDITNPFSRSHERPFAIVQCDYVAVRADELCVQRDDIVCLFVLKYNKQINIQGSLVGTRETR
jgi:hypothetical protein